MTKIIKQRILGNEIRKNNHLTFKQKQLCYGTLMGDANINVRENGKCRMKIGHCERQKEYLEYKKRILKPFIISEKPTCDRDTFYLYNTIEHQDFTDMRGLFYRGNKKKRTKYITRKLLNNIDIYSLLIWYLDDGCYVSGGTGSITKVCRLATNCFTLPEHKTLKVWFWQKFRLDAKISYNSHSETYFIRFNAKSSNKLIEMFKDYISEIPECMHYKLIDCHNSSTTNTLNTIL